MGLALAACWSGQALHSCRALRAADYRRAVARRRQPAQAAGGEGGSGGGSGSMRRPRLRPRWCERVDILVPNGWAEPEGMSYQHLPFVHVTQRHLHAIMETTGTVGFELADGSISRRKKDLPEGGAVKLCCQQNTRGPFRCAPGVLPVCRPERSLLASQQACCAASQDAVLTTSTSKTLLLPASCGAATQAGAGTRQRCAGRGAWDWRIPATACKHGECGLPRHHAADGAFYGRPGGGGQAWRRMHLPCGPRKRPSHTPAAAAADCCPAPVQSASKAGLPLLALLCRSTSSLLRPSWPAALCMWLS